MKAFITSLLIIFTAFSAQARTMRAWTEQELFDQSDLVVMATPTSSSDTQDHIDLPGYTALKVIGVETKFNISAMMKGDKELKTFVLHHYRADDLPANRIMINGPDLLSFAPGDQRTMLLFLVREADGRYAPTVGQTDPGYYGIKVIERYAPMEKPAEAPEEKLTANAQAPAEPGKSSTPAPVRATLELTDGSRLVGTPLESALALKLDFATLEIPLSKITQCEIRRKEELVVLKLQNGDQITGMPSVDKFPLETALGRLEPTFDLIDRITFTVSPEGALPPDDGSINFGNVNWTPWRTMFEIQGDKLVTLPKARPGFNYGHWGNGRSPALMTHVGNKDWKDYSVEVEMGMTGVNPAFNPHGLPAEYRSESIAFHVADSKESWNEKGESQYAFGIDAEGSWSLTCAYNNYNPVPSGYVPHTPEGVRTLANGKGLKIDAEKGNKIRLDVVGTRIQIWVDGENIVDLHDEKMGETVGGQMIDHGGIGIIWGWECMGWMRNFSVKKL